jgi:hypothetical protein
MVVKSSKVLVSSKMSFRIHDMRRGLIAFVS